jgi:GNAT superfamily N-acetyltransferase
MDFPVLADLPAALPRVARWYFDEWATYTGVESAEHVEARLQASLNRDAIPLIVLAVLEGEVVGAAQLKYREMSIYPDREHWLGGVYVSAAHRGREVATELVQRVTLIARQLGVTELHLQTERIDGGLYGRLGWVATDRVEYRGRQVLVMARRIAAPDRG